MAFPQVVQQQTFTPTVATDTYDTNVTLPAGIATGNLLLITATGWDGTADIHPFDLGLDWDSVVVADRLKDGTEVFGRISDGTESSTVVTVGTGSPIDEAVVVRFFEISGGPASVASIEASWSSSGTSQNSVGVFPLTYSGTVGDILWIAMLDSATDVTLSLAGYTEFTGSNTNVTGIGVSAIGYAESATLGSPAGTFTAGTTGVNPLRLTLAIPPAGSVTTVAGLPSYTLKKSGTALGSLTGIKVQITATGELDGTELYSSNTVTATSGVMPAIDLSATAASIGDTVTVDIQTAANDGISFTTTVGDIS